MQYRVIASYESYFVDITRNRTKHDLL